MKRSIRQDTNNGVIRSPLQLGSTATTRYTYVPITFRSQWRNFIKRQQKRQVRIRIQVDYSVLAMTALTPKSAPQLQIRIRVRRRYWFATDIPVNHHPQASNGRVGRSQGSDPVLCNRVVIGPREYGREHQTSTMGTLQGLPRNASARLLKYPT